MQANSPKFRIDFSENPARHDHFFQNSGSTPRQVGHDLSGVVCMLVPGTSAVQHSGQ
jgi:hypothetical protein